MASISKAIMSTRAAIWLGLSMLMAMASFAIGCFEPPASTMPASPTRQFEGEPESAADLLPAWLQDRPDGWSKENWNEYQTSLMDLRQPIVRHRNYASDELETVTAEVEHLPGEYENRILQEWHDKWQGRLIAYERSGGCGCCNEVFTVTGPRAAIVEFPVHRGRRSYYPRYLDRASSE